MTGEELAAAVDELELKLERLRVLYDQFFVGIEKIPPNILQKDVDRRIWVLRREKIRNTGTRFKFQTMIQRYNTFTSYWMRIMREIENGTYKRDVLRAKRRFGNDPTKPTSRDVEGLSPPPPPEEDVELSLDDDADLEELAAQAAASLDKPAAKPAPPRPPPPTVLSHAEVRAPAAPSNRPISKPAPERPTTVNPAVPKILAKKVESDDDLDSMLDEALGTGPSKPPAPPRVSRPQPVAHPFARPAPAAPSPSRPIPAPPSPSPSRPVAQPQPRPAQAAQPRPAAATGADEYRRVYSQYVEAKRKNGESTAGITYETLAKSLEQTKEKLRGKSGGKPIDFEVAVKDGKTILKPVVR